MQPEEKSRYAAKAPLQSVLDAPLDFEEYARSRLQDFAKR